MPPVPNRGSFYKKLNCQWRLPHQFSSLSMYERENFRLLKVPTQELAA
jgi:hypothetical protein